MSQWSFLVPSIGGRYHIIPQLAVYTTYIPLTYILPIGWFYITYHLWREPETAIEMSVIFYQSHIIWILWGMMIATLWLPWINRHKTPSSSTVDWRAAFPLKTLELSWKNSRIKFRKETFSPPFFSVYVPSTLLPSRVLLFTNLWVGF